MKNQKLIVFLTIIAVVLMLYFIVLKQNAKRDFELLVIDFDTLPKVQGIADEFNKKQIEEYKKKQEKIKKEAKTASIITTISTAVGSVALAAVGLAPLIPLVAAAGTASNNIAQKQIYKKGQTALAGHEPIQI